MPILVHYIFRVWRNKTTLISDLSSIEIGQILSQKRNGTILFLVSFWKNWKNCGLQLFFLAHTRPSILQLRGGLFFLFCFFVYFLFIFMLLALCYSSWGLLWLFLYCRLHKCIESLLVEAMVQKRNKAQCLLRTVKFSLKERKDGQISKTKPPMSNY